MKRSEMLEVIYQALRSVPFGDFEPEHPEVILEAIEKVGMLPPCQNNSACCQEDQGFCEFKWESETSLEGSGAERL